MIDEDKMDAEEMVQCSLGPILLVELEDEWCAASKSINIALVLIFIRIPVCPA